MLAKMGRFEAYVPDNDPFQIIFAVLCKSFSSSGSQFEAPSSRLHRFFFNMKKKYPTPFKDIYFNEDPYLPFSEEIANAFTRLQESGYISRPNPSFHFYQIESDLCEMTPFDEQTLRDDLGKVAAEFKEEFKVLQS